MVKVKTVLGGGQIFYCPGCRDVHQVNTASPRWTYNDDPIRPTFSPSILVTCKWSEEFEDMKDEICHSFVTNGKIDFLSDCTHSLAGQTVDIPDWPYEHGKFGGIVE